MIEEWKTERFIKGCLQSRTALAHGPILTRHSKLTGIGFQKKGRWPFCVSSVNPNIIIGLIRTWFYMSPELLQYCSLQAPQAFCQYVCVLYDIMHCISFWIRMFIAHYNAWQPDQRIITQLDSQSEAHISPICYQQQQPATNIQFLCSGYLFS